MDNVREAGEARVNVCPVCGGIIPIGAWPFCRSERNPEGHAKGATYQFKMASKLRRWEKGRIS